ncbi:peptidase M4 [Bacillus suaedaesalsae]|uniref:Peptidase M4 n=1 Tax=Bacillus suaedaesalsae TaxID=2810349 RepID=A0ABS2DN97_9BACI|nr:peptidase M4 [Bacillus suaedaesalsae]MBM6619827.1 peptidase M4 [Bacillus suaedaesalsae]
MKKWIFLGIILFGVFIWFGVHTYQNAFEYRYKQSSKAIEQAKEEVPNIEILDVTYFNGNESYTIVHGKIDGEEHIVCVPNNKKLDIIEVNPEKGITAQEAIGIVKDERNPLEIKAVNLGIEQNIPIWEIIYLDEQNRYSYYYVTFKDGQFIKRYTL